VLLFEVSFQVSRNYHIFIPIYLAAAIPAISISVILPMIPVLKYDLSADVSLILLSVTLFQIPFALGQFFSGGLSDVYGRMKLILAGFIVTSLGFALAIFSTTIWFFNVTRIIQGLGLAIMSPALLALVGDLTEPSQRGRYMGFFNAASLMGAAIGPLLGGVMASQWRFLFMIMAIFSVGLTVYIGVFLRGIGVKGGGSLGDVAEDFRDIVRYKKVLILGVTGFAAPAALFTVMYFSSDALSVFPYYLDSSTIGIILAISGLIGTFAAIIAGFLIDRFGKRWVPIGGIIIAALALITLARVTTYNLPASPLSYIPNLLGTANNILDLNLQVFLSLLPVQILSRFMFEWISMDFLVLISLSGFGISFVVPALMALSIEFVPPQRRGASTSVFMGMLFLGQAVGPLAFTGLYLGMGLDAVFIVGALITPLIIALIFIVTRKKVEREEVLVKKEGTTETRRVANENKKLVRKYRSAKKN